VLAKRLKVKDRFDKRLGLDLGVKILIFPGGYSQDLQDTIFRSNHYRILQGLLRKKTPYFSLGRNRGQGRPRLGGAGDLETLGARWKARDAEGREGNRVGELTSGGDQQEALIFRRGRLDRPAVRLLCGGGAPGVGWRRDRAAKRRHGIASHMVVMACSAGYRVGGTARRSLAPMVAAAAFCRGPAQGGEEAAGWGLRARSVGDRAVPGSDT
jgi:hypothetical protein